MSIPLTFSSNLQFLFPPTLNPLRDSISLTISTQHCHCLHAAIYCSHIVCIRLHHRCQTVARFFFALSRQASPNAVIKSIKTANCIHNSPFCLQWQHLFPRTSKPITLYPLVFITAANPHIPCQFRAVPQQLLFDLPDLQLPLPETSSLLLLRCVASAAYLTCEST